MVRAAGRGRCARVNPTLAPAEEAFRLEVVEFLRDYQDLGGFFHREGEHDVAVRALYRALGEKGWLSVVDGDDRLPACFGILVGLAGVRGKIRGGQLNLDGVGTARVLKQCHDGTICGFDDPRSGHPAQLDCKGEDAEVERER